MSTIEQLLERDGVLVYRTKGVSMEPMLRRNRDLVTIRVPSSPLRKYDVALYRRGDDLVLHRVIGRAEGVYLIRGDNTYSVERVPEGNVIGVLTGFRRRNKDYTVRDPGYRLYVTAWCALYPARAVLMRLLRAAVRLARRTGLRGMTDKGNAHE